MLARTTYPDRAALMASLALRVADDLRAALAARGHATLAVPGGTTPGPFLAALSRADLDWARVVVLPTDERCVPEDHPRSNMAMIRAALLQDRAAAARAVSLAGAGDPAARARALTPSLRDVLPLDVCVLGMGADMHTASLFPGAPELAEALDPAAPPVLAIHPPDQPEPRLTLTAPVLRSAPEIHILITGPEKKAALSRALDAGSAEAAPVRAVLTAPGSVTVHHAD